MNAAQQKLYWREWGATRKALRAAGLAPKEADAKRQELHVEALGSNKSSKRLTNAEFDEILRVFRAVSQPTNTAAQVRQGEQPLTRMRHLIDELARELEVGPEYVDAIAKRVAKRPLRECLEAELRKVIAALQYQVNRERKRAPKEHSDRCPF